jgi:RNA polymerase sigma factor (sigma-70 family)
MDWLALESVPRLLLRSAEAFSGTGMAAREWQQAEQTNSPAAQASTATQKPSSTELAAAIFAGDRRAEQLLIARLTPALRLMLRVQRIPPEDRDDLLQEGLIILLKRLRTKPLDNAENVEAFMEATIRNLRIGDWRRQNRRQLLLDANSKEIEAPMELPPEVKLDANATRQLVRQAVSSLRQTRDQQLIREHYLKEVSKPELCSRLNVTGAHFDRILFNARTRLKSLLCSALGAPE